MIRYLRTVIGLLSLSCSLYAANLSAPKSIYEIEPVRDLSLMGIAAASAITPYLFQNDLIHPRCPCDPNEVNGFDRGAIGNHSDTALFLSDATLTVTLVGPLVANYLALGNSEAFYEDFVVYSQAILASSALVSLTKHLVQRPLP